MSAGEIRRITEKAANKEKKVEMDRSRFSPLSTPTKTTVFGMHRLGIPAERIVSRLEVNRKTAKKHTENLQLFKAVQTALKKGKTVNQAARDLDCPEPLVWSIALEGNRQVPFQFHQTGTLKDRLRFNLNLYSTTRLPD